MTEVSYQYARRRRYITLGTNPFKDVYTLEKGIYKPIRPVDILYALIPDSDRYAVFPASLRAEKFHKRGWTKDARGYYIFFIYYVLSNEFIPKEFVRQEVSFETLLTYL